MRRCASRLAAAMTPPAGYNAMPAYKKAPRADLQPTALERGTGDLPSDPVVRTQANQVSRAPQPSVVAHRVDGSARLGSPVDVSSLAGPNAGAAQLTLAQWLGHVVGPNGKTCALATYLESLIDRDALPLTRKAAGMLSAFETEQLGRFVQSLGLPDEGMVRAQWKAAAGAYTKKLHLFDRAAFDAQLDAADASVLSLFESNGAQDVEGASDEASDAAQTLQALATVLRRDAVLKRNQSLRALADFANAAALAGGQQVWSRFFALVEGMKEELLDADDAVAARYELAAKQSPPTMKPAAALLFAVVTSAAAKASPAATANVPVGRASSGLFDNLHRLSHDDVARFAAANLSSVFDAPNLKLLSALGFADASRTLASVVAMSQTAREQRRTMAAGVVDVFADQAETESLLARIAGASDDTPTAREAKEVLYTVLRTRNLSDGPTVHAALEALGWKDSHRRVMVDLLSSSAVVAAVSEAINSLLQGHGQRDRAGVTGRLVSKDTAEKLADIARADQVVADEAERARQAVARQLVKSTHTGRVLRLLEAHGVDLSPMQALVTERIAAAEAEPPIAAGVYPAIIQEVAQRYPKWQAAGIVDPAHDAGVAPDSAPALRLALNAYLRLAYVPAAGSALLAKRFRNRVGPVAKDAAETNLVGEVGIAEHFDMFEYKKYDWQGWYQRMVDVHNRNASLRCRLADMRVLDGRGKPFIDLQTERRLRILAGERVANGILKLDNDRYEDQADNLEYGTVKAQELLSDAKKAQLGEEYWPSVEVKVRRPSGQTKLHYSTLDWDRVEAASAEAFKKYAKKKSTSLFVSPTDTWLPITGLAAAKTSAKADAEGYTVDLFDEMGDAGAPSGDAAGKPE